jgi:hypothetical protein
MIAAYLNLKGAVQQAPFLLVRQAENKHSEV